MAARGRSQMSSPYAFEPLEKLASSTLKRHPKMELNKADLLKLLSVLEAEVQAREIIIAVLKAEQVKQLLYPKKKNASAFGSDPLSALQRDVFGAFDPNFDEGAVRAVYNVQLHQLEILIVQQRKVQGKLREQLREASENYTKAINELEDERRKHAQDTAQGDDVTYLLEKERERLRQEVDFERQQHKRLEKEAKRLADTLEEERSRQKQIVLVLLDERKRLILRLLDEKQKNIELNEILNDEKGRLEDMVEGLEEESKKSLQMEAELERQLSEFDYERESFKVQLETMELRNQELLCEVDRLNTEMETVRLQHQINEQRPSPPIHLGEGVRSSIVTMVTTPPTIRAVPTVAPTVSPPRGMAKAVSPKTTVAPPATPAKPPGLIVHMPPKMMASPAVSKTVLPAQPMVASAATTKSAKSVKINSEPESAIELDDTSTPDDTTTKSAVSPAGKTGLPTTPVNPSTATVVRKPQPASRGTPPPIPPNKPVLTPQALNRKDLGPKPPVPPRSDMVELAADSKVSKVVRSLSKPLDAIAKSATVEQPQQQQQVGIKDGCWSISSSSIASTAATTTTTLASSSLITAAMNSTSTEDSSLDMFGQELVDFQQLLVSMASGQAQGQWPEVI